jgi:hypothetical protein
MWDINQFLSQHDESLFLEVDQAPFPSYSFLESWVYLLTIVFIVPM